MSRQRTITEHLMLHEKMSYEATGKFTQLLNNLVIAAKIISREVSKAGLLDVIGSTGEMNVQGEQVQKLDDYANRVIIHRMERAGVLCAIASEENADIIRISDRFPHGEYILVMDPLDGSSNIDANVSIGTIFSIIRRISPASNEVTLSDVLQRGINQIASGYIIYGTSTMLVYTTGQGVHGFTLDPSVGEFLLSHQHICIPEKGKIYSVNEGNYEYWDAPTKAAINAFKKPPKPSSARYIGSLVADFHRNLLYGGIFMYPRDLRDPKKPNGKLRLMCEANPLSFIAEQAGGLAMDGVDRIMEIEPQELHQRVPLIIGSPKDVEMVREIYLSAEYN